MSAQATEPEPAGRAGFADAARIITAQYAGGTSLDQMRAHHEDLAASLLVDAQTPDGRAYAREYGDTVRSLIADLTQDAEAARQQAEPGGTPHPDARLAARGWQRCADDCSVYVRRPAAEIDREAG